ncbi:MAG TPA: aldo/keto reductase [Candidatus Saccharimonadales bacterium]|nr:aldo/keto reductase [Candidatus Saccharimonadales bacterium]
MILQTKSGKQLHPIGIGTWNISSELDLDTSARYKAKPVHGNEDVEIEALHYSFDKGQNHIDCAELYGGFYTDEVVGQAIAGYNREDLFIADKLWKSSVGNGQVRPTVEQMLKKLGTNYIDLLYIHAPWEGVAWQEAIPQIDELIDEGIVRYFGVSNFTVEQMQEAMQIAKHPLVVNQMNFNLLHKDEVPQAFRDFCKQHGIQVVAYQPIKRQEVLENGTVKAIAAAHNATPAQVALAWLIQLGMLPIPKATQKAHIDENLKAVGLQLTDEEMARLEML